MTQEPKSLRRKTTDGMVWNSLERLFSKGVQFVFSVLIARLLLPEDYGIIAIANFFISISDIFVDSGFSRALIRKKERDETDYNSVFYFNVGIAALLYLLLWFLAPVIAGYYASPSLTAVIRVITSVLIINALGAIQALMMNVALNFRPIAVSAVVSMLVSGLAAWLLAWRGWGGMGAGRPDGHHGRRQDGHALDARPLAPRPAVLLEEAEGIVLLRLQTAGQRPAGKALQRHIHPGHRQGILHQHTGLLREGRRFSSLPSNLVSGPVKTVTYPAMNGIQDDKARLGESLCQMVGLLSFVILPLMAGLAAVAKPLIAVLLTENGWKWSR